jgi:hypothetical protein
MSCIPNQIVCNRCHCCCHLTTAATTAAAAAAAAAAARPLPQVSQLPYLSVDELMSAPSTSQEGAFGAFDMPVRVCPKDLFYLVTYNMLVSTFLASGSILCTTNCVDELMNAPSTSQEGAFRAFNMPVGVCPPWTLR